MTAHPCLRHILCLVLALLPALAQGAPGRQMIFNTLGLEQGLSQSTANAILQDSRGFVWIATENGLNRFDGLEVQRYFRDQGNPGALPSDFVMSLAEDADGDLWMATSGAGLVRWQRRTGVFEAIDPGEITGRKEARFARTVAIDSAGDIWVGTRGAGLLRFDAAGKLRRQYLPPPDAASPEPVVVLREAAPREAAPRQMLVGTSQGLMRLDAASGNWERVPGVRGSVSALEGGRDGGLWVGTLEYGLYHLPAGGGPARQFTADPGDPGALGSNRVRALLRDRSGRLWVGTDQGLNLWLGDGGSRGDFRVFRHRDGDRYSLADDRVLSLHQSEEGVLWVGTRLGGVSRWNPGSWTLGARNPPELKSAMVMAFADGGDGNIWVGGIGAPLQLFDPAGRLVRRFVFSDGYPELPEAPVTALMRDRSGALWIGTMTGGLLRYAGTDTGADAGTGGRRKLRQWQRAPGSPEDLGADGVMCLFQDSRGTVWAGTFGGGLAAIDRASGKVTRYGGDMRVTAIREGRHGMLWFGTDGDGLGRLDPRDGSLLMFHQHEGETGALGSNTVFSLHIDSSGALWAGTSGAGLSILRRPGAAGPRGEGVEFEHLTTADGLSNNVINGIREDGEGYLWLSSNAGLMRLDPYTREIRYFHKGQGLQSEEFNFGAHHRAADGRLYFGGRGGYNVFDPAAFGRGGKPPRIALTGIEVMNRPLESSRFVDGKAPLKLAFGDDILAFEYAALDYTAPGRNLFSTRLLGFDRAWTPPTGRRRSTYTNLEAGDYVFQVRAANSEGIWSSDPLELRVSVAAAPWATPWAYLLYVLLAAGAVYGFFAWRLRVLEREARIRQLVYYDRSTGLPNRDLFAQRLDAALAQAREAGGQLAVISLRVRSLPQLRRSLGGQSQEEAMRKLGLRLSQQLFGGETGEAGGGLRDLARTGEAEFAASLVDFSADEKASLWARRLCEATLGEIEVAGHSVRVPAFAGIATFPRDAGDAQSLLTCAGTAASDPERDGQRHFAFYDRAMTHRAADRLRLESALRLAIANDALDCFAQGKFDREGRVRGAELLTRWTDAERGPVPPGIFVRLAEESRQIMELDSRMLASAARLLAQWASEGLPPVALAVNVSADTFVSGQVVEVLDRLYREHRFDAALLEIEITESALVRDVDRVTSILWALKERGHPLALDDFGTGYSSLSYLQRFPIDTLKIDQAFVADLESRPDQQALCRTIIAMAGSLGLETVAEGVEREAQREMLFSMGCDRVQGYLLHRPEPVADFARACLSRAATV